MFKITGYAKLQGRLKTAPKTVTRFYGITNWNDGSRLWQYESNVLDLWNNVNRTRDHGVSPVGWNSTHSFYTYKNKVYGAFTNNRHYEANSMLDLWNGIYTNDYPSGAGGWVYTNKFIGFRDSVVGIGGPGGNHWYEATSIENLLNGVYSSQYGPSPVNWSLNNIYFAGPKGVYGVTVDAPGDLYRADNLIDLFNFNGSTIQIAGPSPVSWDVRINRILQVTEFE